MNAPAGQVVNRTPLGDPRGRLLGFWALIATQFQGAFSDNALKWLVSFLVLESSISREKRDFLFVLVVPLVFAVPFLVFSIPGGYLADRYSKRSVTQWTNLLELLTMGGATYALWWTWRRWRCFLFACRERFSGRQNMAYCRSCCPRVS
jgi:MFS family permease